MRFFSSNASSVALSLGLVAFTLTSPVLLATPNSSDTDVSSRKDVDLAKIQAGGKVIFVSSGPRQAAFRAIDNDRRTMFEFSRSDPRPTMIVKLNESNPIHRVSVVVGSQAEKIDIYLLDILPGDPSGLDKIKPTATISEPATDHEAAVEIAPQDARYIALRWTLSKDHSRASAVAEIGVFSDSTPERAVALVTAVAEPPSANTVVLPPLIPVVSP